MKWISMRIIGMWYGKSGGSFTERRVEMESALVVEIGEFASTMELASMIMKVRGGGFPAVVELVSLD